MTSEDLKYSVSMRDVVEQYGIKVDRNGFCCCPFHKEKTGSMKIYKDSYHCFGCGESGDIFSFVQKMDSVDFKTAFKQLGGTYADGSDFQHRLFRYRMEKRRKKEERQERIRQAEKREVVAEIKKQQLYAKLSHVFSDDWCDAMNRLEYLYYKLDYLTEKR